MSSSSPSMMQAFKGPPPFPSAESSQNREICPSPAPLTFPSSSSPDPPATTAYPATSGSTRSRTVSSGGGGSLKGMARKVSLKRLFSSSDKKDRDGEGLSPSTMDKTESQRSPSSPSTASDFGSIGASSLSPGDYLGSTYSSPHKDTRKRTRSLQNFFSGSLNRSPSSSKSRNPMPASLNQPTTAAPAIASVAVAAETAHAHLGDAQAGLEATAEEDRMKSVEIQRTKSQSTSSTPSPASPARASPAAVTPDVQASSPRPASQLSINRAPPAAMSNPYTLSQPAPPLIYTSDLYKTTPFPQEAEVAESHHHSRPSSSNSGQNITAPLPSTNDSPTAEALLTSLTGNGGQRSSQVRNKSKSEVMRDLGSGHWLAGSPVAAESRESLDVSPPPDDSPSPVRPVELSEEMGTLGYSKTRPIALEKEADSGSSPIPDVVEEEKPEGEQNGVQAAFAQPSRIMRAEEDDVVVKAHETGKDVKAAHEDDELDTSKPAPRASLKNLIEGAPSPTPTSLPAREQTTGPAQTASISSSPQKTLSPQLISLEEAYPAPCPPTATDDERDEAAARTKENFVVLSPAVQLDSSKTIDKTSNKTISDVSAAPPILSRDSVFSSVTTASKTPLASPTFGIPSERDRPKPLSGSSIGGGAPTEASSSPSEPTSAPIADPPSTPSPPKDRSLSSSPISANRSVKKEVSFAEQDEEIGEATEGLKGTKTGVATSPSSGEFRSSTQPPPSSAPDFTGPFSTVLEESNLHGAAATSRIPSFTGAFSSHPSSPGAPTSVVSAAAASKTKTAPTPVPPASAPAPTSLGATVVGTTALLVKASVFWFVIPGWWLVFPWRIGRWALGF